jgi:cell division protein FtsB
MKKKYNKNFPVLTEGGTSCESGQSLFCLALVNAGFFNFKRKYMKKLCICLCLLFSFAAANAQKETTVKKTNTDQLNQKLTQLQSNINKLELTFKDAKTLIEKIQSQKDAISELNKQDMLMLQQLMEKKSQLESLISNVIKASSETQSNLAKNLKAS